MQVAKNIEGRQVLTAYAPIPPLGWLVFVELPTDEAYAPALCHHRTNRSGPPGRARPGMFSPACCSHARWWCRSRHCAPAPRGSAAATSTQRISIKTGDEIEALADQFNDMARRLQDSYTDLERKVESRTRELAQSVSELRALGEVSQAVNSTLDLENVLMTIVTNAVQLSNTDAGAIYVFEDTQEEFLLRTTYGMDQATIAALKKLRIRLDNPGSRPQSGSANRFKFRICGRSRPIPSSSDIILRAGYRALLVAPLLRPDNIVGMLVVRRKEPGSVSKGDRSTYSRPSPTSRCWRFRTRACSARSMKRAGSSRSRASTSRSSSPI